MAALTTLPLVAWALRLPFAAGNALAPLRLSEGIELGEDTATGEIWLRGRAADEAVAGSLRALPATARYAWLPDGRLRPQGAILAVERFPDVEWRPLREWLRGTLPVARLAAGMPPPVQLALVSSHQAQPANAALLPSAAWIRWMLDAPALRLAPLRFAATSQGRCLVLGAPLPSLACRACVEVDGVVVPAGLTWQPGVSAAVVRRSLRVDSDAVVLWEEAGVQVLAAELFVAASRSAARATRAAAGSEAAR